MCWKRRQRYQPSGVHDASRDGKMCEHKKLLTPPLAAAQPLLEEITEAHPGSYSSSLASSSATLMNLPGGGRRMLLLFLLLAIGLLWGVLAATALVSLLLLVDVTLEPVLAILVIPLPVTMEASLLVLLPSDGGSCKSDVSAAAAWLAFSCRSEFEGIGPDTSISTGLDEEALGFGGSAGA